MGRFEEVVEGVERIEDAMKANGIIFDEKLDDSEMANLYMVGTMFKKDKRFRATIEMYLIVYSKVVVSGSYKSFMKDFLDICSKAMEDKG